MYLGGHGCLALGYNGKRDPCWRGLVRQATVRVGRPPLHLHHGDAANRICDSGLSEWDLDRNYSSALPRSGINWSCRVGSSSTTISESGARARPHVEVQGVCTDGCRSIRRTFFVYGRLISLTLDDVGHEHDIFAEVERPIDSFGEEASRNAGWQRAQAVACRAPGRAPEELHLSSAAQHQHSKDHWLLEDLIC